MRWLRPAPDSYQSTNPPGKAWIPLLLAATTVVGALACQPADEVVERAGPARDTENRQERERPRRQRDETTPVSSPADERAEAERRLERLTGFIWWNNEEMVERLGLTEEQRATLDQMLHDRYWALRENRDRRQAVQDEFRDAVAAGDWTRAEETADRLAALEADAERFDTDFVLSGLQLLDADQRAKLATDHPHLVERPWLIMRRLGGRRGGGGDDGNGENGSRERGAASG